MSETDFEVTTGQSMGNMPQADVSTSDSDKEMLAIWEKHNGPEALLKNPLMPDVPAGVDEFQATADWMKLPLKERQETSAVHREFANLKKQGEALGMKTETAADMKAIQDMLNGGKDQAERVPTIDKEAQASLDTYKTIVPFAKDHIEARQHLSQLAEHVQRDPKGGSRAVLQHLGIATPLDLLTPQEWEMARAHLMGNGQQPRPAAVSDDGGSVAAWAAERGVSAEDQRAMGDIVSEPTWREIAGEPLSSTLDRAYKTLQRRQQPSAHGRMNRDMDATLRAAAADIYRA